MKGEKKVDAIRFGILGCSEFAKRAMAPAMKQCPGVDLVAIASRDGARAQNFALRFGCDAIVGYDGLLAREDIDAVYIPLPTGLHAQWMAKSIMHGKHVLVEKSFVHHAAEGHEILQMAQTMNLLVMENFLFPHHAQFAWISDRICQDDIGQFHLFRSNFSIPGLNADNIRYNAALGGGALLDLGAYVIKATRLFLGDDLKLIAATQTCLDGYAVDMGGSATFINQDKQVSQVAYRFDSHYQNTWEFYGTKARIVVERAYTPPPGFNPVVRIERQHRREEIILPADNHYINKLKFFARMVASKGDFRPFWDELRHQADCIERLRERAVRL